MAKRATKPVAQSTKPRRTRMKAVTVVETNNYEAGEAHTDTTGRHWSPLKVRISRLSFIKLALGGMRKEGK